MPKPQRVNQRQVSLISIQAHAIVRRMPQTSNSQTPDRSLNILFAGDYLPDYNRTKIVHVGLQKLGHRVIEHSFKKLSGKNKDRLIELASTCDFIYMPSFTHQQVRFVHKAVPNKTLIFDPLVSRYQTKVHDYKLVSPIGLSALRNYFRDKVALQNADFVVTDTQAHLNYFNKKFHTPTDKMGILYIGNNFDEYFPVESQKPSSLFRVGFYGGFIPLQGTTNILKTALLLKDQPDIQFELIGTGFEFEKAKSFVKKNDLKNVSLPGWVPENELPARINQFDIALGIFGETEKSDLVIPNKLYHYGSCARAIITKDSPAIREIFKPGTDLTVCDPKPELIAAKILELKGKPELRAQLGQNIYTKLKENFNEVAVAKKLLSYFYENTVHSVP